MCHRVSLTPLTAIPVIISSSEREDRLTELGKNSETDVLQGGTVIISLCQRYCACAH